MDENERPAQYSATSRKVRQNVSAKIDELFDLSGQVAIVTGGAVNIGRGIVRGLAAAGADVVIAYHSSAMPAQELVGEIEAAGGRALAVQADVRQDEQVRRMVQVAVERFGRVDVLVNNAGIFTVSPQVELSDADWDAVFDTNLKGLFFCTRVVAKQMIAQGGGGCIVNIASINGVHPGFGGTAHYDASKGGVIAYTKALAAELAPYRIRVNAVGPGLIDSPRLRAHAPELAEMVEQRTPLKRLGTPEDIGNAVLFLASRAADWITGQTLFVDGGYLLT
ncbi:MAG TPA: 3-oxoacyl-ACP reductase FabG [Anaerolineae bacterium]|nr:3-oxoacyl-ACP reductase FabG [Anaerolineae bacterium]